MIPSYPVKNSDSQRLLALSKKNQQCRTFANRPLASPLRYPGGKRRLVPYIESLIKFMANSPSVVVEPFAGGAAVTLSLVEAGLIEKGIIGDRDELITAFWKTVFSDDVERLCEMIVSSPIDLEEWHDVKSMPAIDRLTAAYKCLFLNRTSYSGILHTSAGPIGGKSQSGNYQLNCRFPVDSICKRLLDLSSKRQAFEVLDAADFEELIHDAKNRINEEEALWFIDPPFFSKSTYLYRYGFNSMDHNRLRNSIAEMIVGNWIVSYDLHPQVRTLYTDASIYEIVTDYTAARQQASRSRSEEYLITNITSDTETNNTLTFEENTA